MSATTTTTHRLELAVTPGRRELVSAHLWQLGAVGVWEQPSRVVAWFAARPTLTGDLPAELREASLAWSIEPDRDWQAEWKATIHPVHAGRFAVVPTWLADDHRPDPDETTLVLDPGRAFGSGHHATTTLCLELLDELPLDGRTVADVGCGTGVLAIAAARRGSRVVAVDLDPDAVEVTRENAARNDVEVTAIAGSVDELPGPAEVVVANLVTDVVVALAPQLAAACLDVLVVSGIAADRQDVALSALADAGVRVDDVRVRDGWIAARGRVGAGDGSDAGAVAEGGAA